MSGIGKDNLLISRSSWGTDLRIFGETVLRPRRKSRKRTQAQMAILVGVHQSRIHRYELGALPKDPPTARAIADCYRLNPEEREKYFELIGFAKDVDTLSFDQLLTIFSERFDIIRLTDIRGDSRLAIIEANNSIKQLREIIKQITSPKFQTPLKEILGHILYRLAVTYHVTLSTDKLLIVTKPIAEEIETIGNECNNEELIGLSKMCLGGSHYVQKRFDIAMPLFSDASNLVENDILHIEALRGLAISLAHMQGEKELEKVEKTARRIIEKGVFTELSDICGMLEGLGRAQGVLGKVKAFRTLEESSQIYHEMVEKKGKAPLREIQHSMSMLSVTHLFEPTHYNLLENIGMEGRAKAIEYGYIRHAEEIESFLSKNLS